MDSFNALGQMQRTRARNSGYSRDAIADLERQRTLDRMNPHSAPVSPNNIFSNAMKRNNDAFRWDRINGGTGAPMITRARELAPLVSAEQTAGLDPTSRQSILDSPMPEPDTGEGRMRSQPSQPDPFAGGYQAKGRDDPYTARPRKRFADGGTIEGPGGPTDDMVPAVVDGVDPVWLSDGERVTKTSTTKWMGEKFFADLDKKADKERAEYEAAQGGKPKSVMPMPMPENGSAPGYADGGTIERIANAATRARQALPSMPVPGYAEGGTVLANNPDEQEFGLRRLAANPYGSGYSVTPMPMPLPAAAAAPSQPAPAFEPDPNTLASLRQRRQDLRPMPEMDQGQQPAINVASPMPEPVMKPAPQTMTEQERMFTPARPSRTPQVAPDFEASLVGQSGMGKRRARAAYIQEQALWNRDDQRQQITDARTGAKDEAKRAIDFEEFKQKQIIQDQFNQASENRQIGNNAAISAGKDRQNQAAAAAAAEANRRFSPVLDEQGNPIPGRMMNPQGQQLNTEPTRADGIRMEPVPGMPGRVLPMMGGSRVPGMPMMQANTAPGPFREGLGRTTFTPVQETEPAKAPTVRKTAPRKGFSAEAPEWEYASLSDGSTRPITIDNPLPTQTKERFQHQYGRAPQTEQEWTEAWYLTTGQPMPAASGNPASASASTAPASRAKIKSITPVS